MTPELHKPFRPAHRAVPVPRTTLCDSLAVSARRYPDRTAVHYYGSSLSYAQLLAQVEALAGYLQGDAGVRKGDRVLLYLQNSPQFIIGFHAILRADAVVVPVNPMNLAEELAHYGDDADARVVIAGSELWSQVQPLLDQGTLRHAIVARYADCLEDRARFALPDVVQAGTAPVPHERAVAWRDALGRGHTPSPHEATCDDLAVMPYTSGTTGKPKGCLHTHHTLMAVVGGTSLLHELSQADVVLSVAPFFHITGLQLGMNAGLHHGASLVVMTRWDREAALDLIEAYRVSFWVAIPTMVVDLLGSPKLHRDSLASLRQVTGGGTAMPEAVAQRLIELSGLTFIEAYGMTETAAPTHTNPLNRPRRQCLGVPIFNTDSRIVDPQTLAPLPTGAVGEIVSHGPQVFKGYWNNPQATRDAFIEIDGKPFFRTGDLGRVDEDGYFYLVDRLKRMINASGYKVWPAEVEALLYGHPAVQEACVIGTRDAKRGETVKALVVLKAGVANPPSEDEFIAWAREHMAAYKVPRIVTFVPSLPKSGTGKVQWRELQEREARGR